MTEDETHVHRVAFAGALQRGKNYGGARHDANTAWPPLGAPLSRLLVDTLTAELEEAWPDWVEERPPLTWYSPALALVHIDSLPSSQRLPLAKAANYYGDSELALTLTDPVQSHGVAPALETYRIRARAYRHLGRFSQARETYSEAIAFCSTAPELAADLAHFLMLFAKLCHDYQQRQGWYREYHRIAANRFRRSLAVLDRASPAAARLTSWQQLADDSLAKAESAEYPARACRVFQRCLRSLDSSPETTARLTAHLIETRLIQAAREGRSKTLATHLTAFADLVDRLERAGNVRAACVRHAQYLRLVREHALMHRDDPSVRRATDRLVGGEWLEIAQTALRHATRLADVKTETAAAIELATWPRVVGQLTGREPDSEVSPALLLDRALDRLTSGDAPVAHLLHSVIEARVELDVEDANWGAAVAALQQALEFDVGLKGALAADEEHLEAAITVPSAQTASLARAEFLALTRSERRALQSAVRIDYRILMERLLVTSDRIRRFQRQQLSRDFGITLSLTRDFQFHTMNDKLRRLALLKNFKAVRRSVSELSGWLKEWSLYEQTVFQPSAIDLGKHVDSALADYPALGEYKAQVRCDESLRMLPTKSVLDARFVPLVLENLILNAIKAATRAGRPDSLVTIGAAEVDRVVFLWVEDDGGDAATLLTRVEALNRGEGTSFGARPDQRHGFEIIKRFLDLAGRIENWRVERVAEGRKRLLVPIGVLE